MTDFLRPRLDSGAIGRMSNLALAHIGDCVYELMTRSYLSVEGVQTSKALHRATIQMVKAGAQAAAAQAIEPILTPEEHDVFRRGRNAKPKTVPKSSTCAEYAYATALEALFGWLYLNGKYDRLNELYAACLPFLRP